MKVPVVLLQALRFAKSFIKPSDGRFPEPKYVNPDYCVQERCDFETGDRLLRFVEGKTGKVVKARDVRFIPKANGITYKGRYLGNEWYCFADPIVGSYQCTIDGVAIAHVEKLTGDGWLWWSIT